MFSWSARASFSTSTSSNSLWICGSDPPSAFYLHGTVNLLFCQECFRVGFCLEGTLQKGVRNDIQVPWMCGTHQDTHRIALSHLLLCKQEPTHALKHYGNSASSLKWKSEIGRGEDTGLWSWGPAAGTCSQGAAGDKQAKVKMWSKRMRREQQGWCSVTRKWPWWFVCRIGNLLRGTEKCCRMMAEGTQLKIRSRVQQEQWVGSQVRRRDGETVILRKCLTTCLWSCTVPPLVVSPYYYKANNT